MEITAVTWNCQGSPFNGKSKSNDDVALGIDKEKLLAKILDKADVVMLQETGNPDSWGLKDGVFGTYKEHWHACFCSDDAAYNQRCSVGLLIRADIKVETMALVRSGLSRRPLVIAKLAQGYLGSFHAIASDSAAADWKAVVGGLLKENVPRWWLIGGDFNDDLIDRDSANAAPPHSTITRAGVASSSSSSSSNTDGAAKEQIASYPGITQKSGGSIDGFRHGGAVKQFAGLYRIFPDELAGSRIVFTSDHGAIAGKFHIG